MNLGKLLLLGLGGVVTYVGYEHFYGDGAKPASAAANPYASSDTSALIDQAFSQPDVVSKLAVSAFGAPSIISTPMIAKTNLKAAWVSPSAATALEASYDTYSLAMNVDTTGTSGTSVNFARRTDAKLSQMSQDMLVELSTRFGNRAISLTSDPALKSKVEAALNEDRRAIDEADSKGSSTGDMTTLVATGIT